MNLKFNTDKAKNYKNNSQIARVLTEDWVKSNSYCPNCGEIHLQQFTNNKPVADFYCIRCKNEYELKSKKGKSIGKKIADGAYSTMIERINSNTPPNFFILTYDRTKWEVNNFIIIPKHYFVSDMIEKRKALSQNAKRAGWIGCNVDITKVPNNGKIYLIKDSKIISKETVLEKWQRTEFLKNKKGVSKGWILDVMNCVDAIKKDSFTLKDVYQFEDILKTKYPENNFIKDKIRQQLQLLRDKGIIEFKSRGHYKKINL